MTTSGVLRVEPAGGAAGRRHSDTDVVLASQWRFHWSVGNGVLPLAFPSGANEEGKAAETILLSQVTRNRFGLDVANLPESLKVLTLRDRGTTLEIEPELSRLIDALQSPAPDAATVGAPSRFCRTSLRRSLVAALGSPGHDDLLRLRDLRERLLVPGLTSHQAKGREWNCVGIKLDAAEAARLREGLVYNRESDRKIYVACTRARRRTLAVKRAARHGGVAARIGRRALVDAFARMRPRDMPELSRQSGSASAQ